MRDVVVNEAALQVLEDTGDESSLAKSTFIERHPQREAQWLPSRYNYFVHYDQNTYYAYNLLYRSMIRIPNEAYPLVDQYLAFHSRNRTDHDRSNVASLPDSWIDALKETRMLVPSACDEIRLLKFRYYRSLYANDFLSLVILPTLWCNFDCPYCFEFKKRGVMKATVESALKKWISTRFAGKRHIHVGWFGGEPLLQKALIIRLSKWFTGFTHGIGATYEASLTTNGFYFVPEFQAQLDDLHVRNVQITLDGDEEDHNRYRAQRNRRGSFRKIFENILAFPDARQECQLTIRVNCSDENFAGIPRLLQRFPESVRTKCRVFFRWIWPNKACGYKEFATHIPGGKPYEALAALYTEAAQLGWRTENPNARILDAYCEVDYLDHYSVGPDGSLYLCSHTYEEEDSIGNLLRTPQPISDDAADQYAKWYTITPFEDPQCLECILLPVCSGGCRKSRMMGQRACIEERRSLDKFVHNIVTETLRRKNST